METGLNFVIFVINILDFEKDMSMKLSAMVFQIMLWDLPGICHTFTCKLIMGYILGYLVFSDSLRSRL